MDEWIVLAIKQIAVSTVQLTELQQFSVPQIPQAGILPSPGPPGILSGG